MRIDLFLYEKGLARSRSEAKSLLLGGAVSVNDKIILKSSFEVDESDIISINRDLNPYVSRGGLKLEGAIKYFSLDPTGLRCLDIGASSGGFTDCLLKKGAAHVIALDSGSGQLVDSIRYDERVTVIENYNARYLSPCELEYSPDFVVMDVSFISATYIIPAIASVTSDKAEFVCLIKPQFEVGKAGVGKGGIVKDDKVRRSAVDKVVGCARDYGFKLVGVTESPIRGGDGNLEYLAYFVKGV